MQPGKTKTKECLKCRSICELLKKEHNLIVDPHHLPELCKETKEKDDELQTTIQVLRQTNSNVDAQLRKENALLLFEINDIAAMIEKKEEELAQLKEK